ncbi:MAG: pseudouridine synthase [Bacteroidia bacterium]|nr:pseudouridine synthase [Bacteroidia bacterium]MBP9688406.1 pseudouridine synthase [Bacteroidia bacterium]
MNEKIFKYYAIYKPFGYLSQFVCEHNNKKLLGDLYTLDEDVMPIGRLDEPSEGLLLLSNNGQFHQHLLAHQVEKEYWVLVEGDVTNDTINLLEEGVDISHQSTLYKTKPAKVKRIADEDANFFERYPRVRYHKYNPHTWLSITLKEGRFRQVRKMTAVVGHPTLRLVRMRVGNYKISTKTPIGLIEEVNPKELVTLFNFIG